MNRLIVEGSEDKLFITHLLQTLGNVDVQEINPIDGIENFEYSNKLEKALITVKNDVIKKSLKKVGLILDQDDKENDRIAFLNKHIHIVFGKQYSLINQSESIQIEIDGAILELSLFVMNVNGAGEMNSMLRIISTQPSNFADCLQHWKVCADPKSEIISNNEFDKLWVHYFIRWDNSTKEQRANSNKNCTIKAVLENKPQIFDFENKSLDDLKNYLNQFVDKK